MSIERRITNQMIEYWVSLKGTLPLPLGADIKQADLKDVWGSCFQVDVLDVANGSGYSYSYFGEEIKEAYGCDLATDEENMLISTVADKLDAQYQGVLSSRMPMESEGEFINANGKRVAFRQCLLPFSSDGVNANCVFGGMRYKIYDE